jgi:signal transduction histidine kinase/ligand-binding sensor domain-containing protein
MRLAPLLLLLSVPAAFALDPSRAISQYGHMMWTLQDGVLPGAPTSVAQTTDGYLWVGTRTGLVRFDGVRFVPFSPPEGEKLHSSRILALRGTSDGSLWIGTRAGLERWHRGHLTFYPDAPGAINAILEDRNAKIWFTSMTRLNQKGPLCEVAGDRILCHGIADGVPLPVAQDMTMDAQGNIWTVSQDTLMRWQGGIARTWLPPGVLRESKDTDVVQSVELGKKGEVWVGAVQPSRGLGLLHLQGDELRSFVTPELDGSKLSVSPLRVDRNNALWIGTQDDGLYRLYEGKVSHFRRADGLSGDTVQNLFWDREETLWVLTTRGIDAFRDLRVASLTSREGLSADLANGVLVSRDGTVWIDNWHSLEAWRDGKVTSFSARTGLPGDEVMLLYEDPAGTLWVGIDDELTVFEGGKFVPVRQADGSAIGVMQSAVTDSAGDLWVVARSEKLFRIRERKIVERVPWPKISFAYRAIAADPRGGIWLPLTNGDLARYRHGELEVFEFHREPNTGTIADLVSFADGAIVGATALGLAGWREGKTQTMTAENGLPCVDIHAVLIDRHEGLWLYATCGIIFVAADQVRAWWKDPRAALTFRLFDAFDGAQPARANFFPKASKGPDGRLWFANASIVQMVDPERLDGNPVVPPVQIERLVADRAPFPLGEDVRLPPNSSDLQIDYTGLSLVVPGKTQFRYRLIGHDSNWQEVGTRRQAFFTDLPPRDYVFEVSASNNDGVWNQKGARLAFSIAPTFTQTPTFVVLCVLSALFALWLLFMYRVRQIEQRVRMRAEERIAERERIARELHDTLLQGILSASMQLSVANSKIEPDAPSKSLVERILQLLRQVIDEGRNAVRDLRTPNPASDVLEQALAQIPQDLGMDEKVRFRLLVEGAPRALRSSVSDEVYRICREALANAFHHSKAETIETTLEYSADQFRMAIRDNGCGLDPVVLQSGREGHWGLSGMRERATRIGATLRVLSAPGAGTEIDLTVPAGAAFETAVSRRWTDWLGRLHLRSERE